MTASVLLKVSPHFGVEAVASDLVGRKYWPLVLVFQKIDGVDHNSNKGHLKVTTDAAQSFFTHASWATYPDHRPLDRTCFRVRQSYYSPD